MKLNGYSEKGNCGGIALKIVNSMDDADDHDDDNKIPVTQQATLLVAINR
ncbi:hypothetical protein DERF_001538 [Dermatophagoides farinae]|uniref:Uncharacterized protein n=1 Tax=Dermatophagoides farinae TaxID=6954 RepID=A0A922L9R3_DERFA|nr:hypothetical protein DERF_001538 [Dermatophagoides farinae]